MDLPLPSTSARTFRPYRRRRILWTLFFLTIAAVYLLAPSSFWDMGSSQARKLAEAGKSWVPESLNKFNSGGESPYTNGEELQALLHMVASSELRIPPESDPSKPLARDVYSGGTENVAWLQQVQPDPPVIVFSKVYFILVHLYCTRSNYSSFVPYPFIDIDILSILKKSKRTFEIIRYFATTQDY